MIVNMILAVDEKMGIGKEGSIPWICHEYTDFFNKVTRGSIVLMGRKTYDSLGRNKFRKRKNVVVTSEKIKNINCIEDPEQFIKHYIDSDKELFIIGGSSLFNKYAKYTDTIYVARMPADCECDVFTTGKIFYKKVVRTTNWLTKDVVLETYTK